MSRFPSENSNTPEDPSSEHGILDGLIEASLCDWLGGCEPSMSKSCLSDEIAKRSKQSLFTNPQLDQAVHSARLDLQQIARRAPNRSKPRNNLWISVAAIAATLAICSLVGWWNYAANKQRIAGDFKGSSSHQESRVESHVDSSKQSGELQARVEGSPEPKSRSGMPASETVLAPKERLQDGSNKLAVNDSQNASAATKLANERTASTPSDPISSRPGIPRVELGGSIDREIVSVIDSQFQQIWNQLGLLDTGTKKGSLTVDRISRLILHRVPTSAEFEAIRRETASTPKSTQEQALEKTLKQWITSDEFNRVWAERLAQFYLGKRSSTHKSYSAFRDWIEVQVREDMPIQEIQRQVLLGLWRPEHPAYFLGEQWIEESESSHSTSALWVGLSQAQSGRLRGLSRLFLNATGNVAIGCTQCHGSQAEAFPHWLADRMPPVAPAPGASAVVFDSIAAMMAQISPIGKAELFTKEQDDRISKIPGRLPDGKRVAAELSIDQVVGAWVDQGSWAQSGLINALWRDFFGQALHSEFGLDSGIAVQDRKDLMEYLGKQAHQQQAGVRQIVYWMLMSEPSRAGQETLSLSQYMAMDPKKLQDYSKRLGGFHSIAIPSSGSRESTHLSIDSFASKLFPEQPDWLDRSLLAQPAGQLGAPTESAKTSTSAASSDAASSFDLPILRAELQYRSANTQLQDMARMLADSDLSDEQIVEHSYLIAKHRFPSVQELKAWNASSWSKSDRNSSVLRLLVAIDSLEAQ